MNNHKNARLTTFSRALLVHRILHEGLRPEAAAQSCPVSVRTAYKCFDLLRQFVRPLLY
ncbi:leucine zipper domain-containing protein, partial [Stenotrophomonas maltophilia]|uniref:leucine zipper domain-containing protein n=1 Tax=Stenotrophomonas maltophilia TaxID=40324 RepID=UPI0021AD3BD0